MTNPLDATTDEWTLPAARQDDAALTEKLLASGGTFSPRKEWDIECMTRVVARELDAFGLLEAPTTWLEIRSSHSEMAGGLTVEFMAHPDEPDPAFRKLRHFRFRGGRVEKSNQALDDMHRASARRLFLMRRRAAIDTGTMTPEQGLLCDAVLAAHLAAHSKDVDDVASLLATEGSYVIEAPSGKTDGSTLSTILERSGDMVVVRTLKLDDETTYTGNGAHPRILARNRGWTVAERDAMTGRPISDYLPQPELAIEGLTIISGRTTGDATSFLVTRPLTTLAAIPQ